MKLYLKPGACSLSPHIALHEAGLSFDIEKVDLATKRTESGADFKAINAKGYIPALRKDDGELLTEGLAIVLYVASLAPKAKLTPEPGTPGYFRVVEWLGFIATELHKSCGALFRPGVPEEWKATVRDMLKGRLAYVNGQLAEGGPFLLGEQFTVADGYLFTIGTWLPHLGFTVAEYPALEAYLGRVRQRPAVQAALKAEGLI
jgi:glutathione S-transferase